MSATTLRYLRWPKDQPPNLANPPQRLRRDLRVEPQPRLCSPPSSIAPVLMRPEHGAKSVQFLGLPTFADEPALMLAIFPLHPSRNCISKARSDGDVCNDNLGNDPGGECLLLFL
jgi:hypothetical protein